MLCNIILLLSTACSLVVAAPYNEDVARAAITPAPEPVAAMHLDARAAGDIDPIMLAQILLFAVPQSLKQIAATNIAAASKVLWSEFLDGHTPSWFGALPSDIQTYLSEQFGPKTGVSASTTLSSLSITSSSASSTPSSVSTILSTSTSGQVTSIVTETVGSASPTNSLSQAAPSVLSSSVGGGLSTAAKIGIGAGVGVAVLLLLGLLLACCLLRRRRKRKNGVRGDSRPPTPAFISSSFQRTPGGYGGFAADPNRDNSSKYSAIVSSQPVLSPGPYDHATPRDIPPIPVTAGNGRHSHNQNSLGSLGSVPEEEDRDLDAIGVLPPARSSRRSRNSFSSLHDNGYGHDADPFSDRNRIRSSYAPLTSPTAANYNNTYDRRASQDYSPEPDITAHPAYRNRNSFSTPSGPYQNDNRRSVSGVVGGYAPPPAAKPLLSSSAYDNRTQGFDHPTTTTTITANGSPGSVKRKSLPAGVSSNPFSKKYWKVQGQRPPSDYDAMYEGT